MAIRSYKKDGSLFIGFFCDACGKRIEKLTGGGILGNETDGHIYFDHKGTGCCQFIEKKYNGGNRMGGGDLYDFIKALIFDFKPRNKWNEARKTLKKIFGLCPDPAGQPTKVTFWEEIFF